MDEGATGSSRQAAWPDRCPDRDSREHKQDRGDDGRDADLVSPVDLLGGRHTRKWHQPKYRPGREATRVPAARAVLAVSITVLLLDPTAL